MRCSQAAASTGAKAVIRTLHPAAFWRLGDFLLPGTMVPHAFYRKHDKDSSRRGGGGRQTFPVPLSRKILRYLSFLSFSQDPGRAVEDAARGEGNRGREI